MPVGDRGSRSPPRSVHTSMREETCSGSLPEWCQRSARPVCGAQFPRQRALVAGQLEQLRGMVVSTACVVSAGPDRRIRSPLIRSSSGMHQTSPDPRQRQCLLDRDVSRVDLAVNAENSLVRIPSVVWTPHDKSMSESSRERVAEDVRVRISLDSSSSHFSAQAAPHRAPDRHGMLCHAILDHCE